MEEAESGQWLRTRRCDGFLRDGRRGLPDDSVDDITEGPNLFHVGSGETTSELIFQVPEEGDAIQTISGSEAEISYEFIGRVDLRRSDRQVRGKDLPDANCDFPFSGLEETFGEFPVGEARSAGHMPPGLPGG